MNDTFDTLNGAVSRQEKSLKRGAKQALDSAAVVADDVTGKIRAAADDAEKRLRKYSEASVDFVRENPFYVALAVAACSAAIGAFFMSRGRKSSSEGRG
jgi:ElaB/YqjD/DUF883 family membrane-anchored ribosome-binding protein